MPVLGGKGSGDNGSTEHGRAGREESHAIEPVSPHTPEEPSNRKGNNVTRSGEPLVLKPEASVVPDAELSPILAKEAQAPEKRERAHM